MTCPACGNDNVAEARFCARCGTTLIVTAALPSSATPISTPPTVTMEYMGFWIRFIALVLDSFILSIISGALTVLSLLVRVGGGDLGMTIIIAMATSLLTLLIPGLYYWLFTGLKGQTPGKMAAGIRVVDARGNVPGLARAALREALGKTLSTLAFLLGFLWVAFDRQKQGWHDKIAGTYVVRARR